MNQEELLKHINKNAESIIRERVEKSLKETGRYVFEGFFSVKLEPRRKGENNGFGKGGKINYTKRLKFITSTSIKDNLCK